MKTNIFESLKYRNYRLFFAGQIVSVMGTWLQMTAMPWLVYRLTDSALLLGLIGFLSQIFILVLAPFAGTFADRYDKKKILLVTQSLAMVQALVLAILTLSGHIQAWHLIVLATSIGVINAFDMPARQAFVIEMVEREHLINAIGLNSLIFNSARLAGPAAAGILIAALGEGYCFLLNAVSFIAVLAALAFIHPAVRAPAAENEPIGKRLAAGIEYLRGSKTVSAVLLLLAATGLVGIFPTILMPVFVRDVYHMDASGLGLFMSAMGVGALLATLNIAGKRSIEGVEKTIFVSAVNIGIAIIAFSMVRNVVPAMIILAFAGYYVVLQMGLTNTYIQMTTPDHLRGRVMGFFIMAFMGFAPIGSIAAGSLTHALSAPVTVALGGAVALFFALILKRRIFVNAPA
jgi:Arabinose efflux permease